MISNTVLMAWGRSGTPSNYSVTFTYPLSYTKVNRAFSCGVLSASDMTLNGFGVISTHQSNSSCLFRTRENAPALFVFIIGY